MEAENKITHFYSSLFHGDRDGPCAAAVDGISFRRCCCQPFVEADVGRRFNFNPRDICKCHCCCYMYIYKKKTALYAYASLDAQFDDGLKNKLICSDPERCRSMPLNTNVKAPFMLPHCCKQRATWAPASLSSGCPILKQQPHLKRLVCWLCFPDAKKTR